MKKFKFVKATHIKFSNLDYGYLLEVPNLETYLIYDEQIQDKRFLEALYDVKRAVLTNTHTSNVIASVIEAMAKMSDNGLLYCATKFIADTKEGQLKTLQNEKLYFQQNGSYLNENSIKISETIEKDNLVWPDAVKLTMKDAIITKWPGGNHYYITISGKQLGKYNTVEFAESFAKMYIDAFNKELGRV